MTKIIEIDGVEYDVDLAVNELLKTEALIKAHDQEVKEVNDRHGIKLLNDRRTVQLSILLEISKKKREAHDHEGDQGVIKLGALQPKGNSVKINLAIEYLEKMKAQKKIGTKQFNEIVTYGQGDKKRTSKIELF
tara:strand:- start:99 stop:500 length:402 start_codon:yes stop_codon:yes gene_type:complete